jgi:hypothetical protein
VDESWRNTMRLPGRSRGHAQAFGHVDSCKSDELLMTL